MESYLVQCKHSLNFNQVKCNKKLFKLTSSPYPNPHTRLCIYTCTWLCNSVGRVLLQNRKVTGLIHARGPKCCIFHNHSPLMSKMVYIICPLEMSTFWYTLQCLLRLVSKLYHPRRTELHFFTFIDTYILQRWNKTQWKRCNSHPLLRKKCRISPTYNWTSTRVLKINEQRSSKCKQKFPWQKLLLWKFTRCDSGITTVKCRCICHNPY